MENSNDKDFVAKLQGFVSIENRKSVCRAKRRLPLQIQVISNVHKKSLLNGINVNFASR